MEIMFAHKKVQLMVHMMVNLMVLLLLKLAFQSWLSKVMQVVSKKM